MLLSTKKLSLVPVSSLCGNIEVDTTEWVFSSVRDRRAKRQEEWSSCAEDAGEVWRNLTLVDFANL